MQLTSWPASVNEENELKMGGKKKENHYSGVSERFDSQKKKKKKLNVSETTDKWANSEL